MDLVTTGPEARGVTGRDTSVVVRELFAHAERSVLVVGYAIYQGQQVFRALADRMQDLPQLQVRMFLDVQRLHGEIRPCHSRSRKYDLTHDTDSIG